MNITRRGLLALIPGILLIPAVGAMAATPARSEALQWVLDHLEPGTLLSVKGDDREVRDFVEEVYRETSPSELITSCDGRSSPLVLKQEAMIHNLPALNTNASRDLMWEVTTERMSDIVVHIENGEMWVTKHRHAFNMAELRKSMRMS